jgi:protoporphyrin/coproporphyrin ferrochelatase
MRKQSTGIILLNMGGPEKLADVRPFLFNLFSDRNIIRLGPAFLQRPLARLISHLRAPKSEAIYARIGGGSPLRKISNHQAETLEKSLREDGSYHVRVAMRYWQPTAEEALVDLLEHDVDRIIALPLYPHYSRATSGSSLLDLRSAHRKVARDLPLVEIPSWPDHPLYIQALSACITEKLASFGETIPQIVYSAHSLPVSFIEKGDPYVNELHKTIAALEQSLNITGKLCYQSRSGPVQWLSPSTSATISELATAGCTNILMIPISFVSDHVETLYEINILFREEAAALGIRLEASSSLNTNPLFIGGLRDLVLTAEQSCHDIHSEN